ncbi:50S ribosomal protein L13 [Ferrimicrobium sp.]|uniref:50S ribosomal protein L13 n=1 Tax=Ferrimicrobium sp. TaxID=2926050 RepID=UPI002601EB9B|nr:50S ribosomal protein L13 [Ferrimicrobium sp.]
MKTFVTTTATVEREWWVVDAKGLRLGRLATEVASLLKGKHKPYFAPYLDCGDHVVVINADMILLSGAKAEKKVYYHHSGYPGGLRESKFLEMMEKHPERAVELAIKGMLPKNRLGRQMFRKLKVYAGPSHPHAAQQPTLLDLSNRMKAL